MGWMLAISNEELGGREQQRGHSSQAEWIRTRRDALDASTEATKPGAQNADLTGGVKSKSIAAQSISGIARKNLTGSILGCQLKIPCSARGVKES